jgi:hypothetical protein
MIVTEAADRYRFITQPDHAALSGQLAARWGDAFARPDPWQAVCIAAARHDQGWAEYDTAPHRGEDGVIDFISVPAESWTAFYAAGVESVAAIDRYAGLLVSMHAAGLKRSAYGTRPGIPDRSGDPRFAEFVSDQERFQRRVGAELANDNRYGEYVDETELAVLDALHETGSLNEAVDSIEGPSRLGEQYLLLQVFDTLSLALTRSVSLEPTGIGPVPTDDGELTDLTATPIGPGAMRVDPYPFDRSPLSVSVDMRVLPARDSEPELTAAYHTAERRPTTFVFYC